jgi:hypothetical protein
MKNRAAARPLLDQMSANARRLALPGAAERAADVLEEMSLSVTLKRPTSL